SRRSCIPTVTVRPTQRRRRVLADARAVSASGFQPRVAGGVLSRIVGIEVDEHALDLPVADLEHVAPPPGTGLGITRPPRPVLMFAVARALGDDRVAAREDPVEVG